MLIIVVLASSVFLVFMAIATYFKAEAAKRKHKDLTMPIDLCGDFPLTFLSHHKGAAGDTARLLKMLMHKAGMQDIFLDSGTGLSTWMIY